LGLSISYSIIKECGGTIHAKNRESGGACFLMYFPALDMADQDWQIPGGVSDGVNNKKGDFR
jgi:K+-sensing histidine kinase KdpD